MLHRNRFVENNNLKMITDVIPKLPYINKQQTMDYYSALGGNMCADYGDYFIVEWYKVELHFFSYPTLDPAKSDFMIYLRVHDIESLYETFRKINPPLPRLEFPQVKPWGQKEFHLIDPNGTLLTFGQSAL